MSIHKIRIEGGPHGHDVRAFIDDAEVPGVTRMVLDVNAMDAIRLTTYQIVQAVVTVEGVRKNIIELVVSEPRFKDDDGKTFTSWTEVVRSRADTLHEALYDCARQLEFASRGVAQAGTIEESGGRPPGH